MTETVNDEVVEESVDRPCLSTLVRRKGVDELYNLIDGFGSVEESHLRHLHLLQGGFLVGVCCLIHTGNIQGSGSEIKTLSVTGL